jgi:hypothetical protein
LTIAFVEVVKMLSVQVLPPVDPSQRYTIVEANLYLRQSRAKTYQDIAQGKLVPIKDGSRVYIPGSQIIQRSTLAAA